MNLTRHIPARREQLGLVPLFGRYHCFADKLLKCFPDKRLPIGMGWVNKGWTFFWVKQFFKFLYCVSSWRSSPSLTSSHLTPRWRNFKPCELGIRKHIPLLLVTACRETRVYVCSCMKCLSENVWKQMFMCMFWLVISSQIYLSYLLSLVIW